MSDAITISSRSDARAPAGRGFGYTLDLVGVLLVKELKVRYKNTLLGYAWSILNPLAFAFVFYFLFKEILKIQVEDYVLVLITGLFPWQWFANSTATANGFFVSNASLLKRVAFPRSILVFTGVLNDVIHYLASLIVIVAFLIWFQKFPQLSWLWLLPLLMAVQFLLTSGLGFLISTANLFFRDLERITSILTLLLFYLTPVLYPLETIPDKYLWTTYANPMAGLVICWRSLFFEGKVPWDSLGWAALISSAFFGIGVLVYRRMRWRFTELV